MQPSPASPHVPAGGQVRSQAASLFERGLILALICAGTIVIAPTPAAAQRGVTLTPDYLNYIINRDVGNERWTITVNLATSSPPRIMSFAGNVYRANETPVFIWCQPRPESTGTLTDSGSEFRLTCKGAGACGSTALECSRGSWNVISDDIVLPAAFFLPSATGNTSSSATTLTIDGLRALANSTPASSTGHTVLTGNESDRAGRTQVIESRGTSLPPDTLNFLVNKDVGGQRWSVSLNLVPAQDVDAALNVDLPSTLDNRLLNVTGNVFPANGGPPAFLFCQARGDSLGKLTAPESIFRLACYGMGPCERSAAECADSDWQPVAGAENVQLPASFFLPPGGLPAAPQSDPEIVIIGRTSDGASYLAAPSASKTSKTDRLAASCAPGAPCSLDIGSCSNLSGRQQMNSDSGACQCKVENVPLSCTLCGDAAAGQCGGACAFSLGLAGTARGTCLPFARDTQACICVPAAFDSKVEVALCGGPLGTTCPSGQCCQDDPRDGCDPSRDERCAGLCVDARGCDPAIESCPGCFDERSALPQVCAGQEIEPGAACCDDNLCRNDPEKCVCRPGSVCVLNEDACCPTNLPKACQPLDGGTGVECNLESAECCENGTGGHCDFPDRCPKAAGADFCLRPDDLECGLTVCNLNFACLSTEDGCRLRSDVDCGDGTSCPWGTRCQGARCGRAKPDSCGNGLTCPFANDLVCSDDGNRCQKIGSEDCGNGLVCDPGSICSPDRSTCTPLVDCGDWTCAPGETCVPGGRCLPVGRVLCSPLTNCLIGQICGSGGCLEPGEDDCGDGSFCPEQFRCSSDGESCEFQASTLAQAHSQNATAWQPRTWHLVRRLKESERPNGGPTIGIPKSRMPFSVSSLP
jgi:hypothetical protein